MTQPRILSKAGAAYFPPNFLSDTSVPRHFIGDVDPTTVGQVALGDRWYSTKPAGSTPITQPADWSTTNLPWAYTSTSDFTSRFPAGTRIVDIQTGSADFWTNLSNTVAAAGARVVVRLGAATYHLNSFRLIGTSGDVKYAFGFWFPNLQGFLGQGPDKTIIQMDPNSVSSAQLSSISAMTTAAGAPLQMGFARFDGLDSSSPVLLAGLTFRGTDQPLMTTKASDLPANVPQPCPFQGVTFYSGTFGIVDHVRFQAAAHAATSSPPFEMAGATSQRASMQYFNCEWDGRLAPEVDSAQPRRCGIWMGNNETLALHQDCWFHHSNVSRYAANDQNINSQGAYTLIRCKIEQVTNTHNVDPVYGPLLGYTNAALCGWESCNATISLTDCILSVDNSFTDNGSSQHLQFTTVTRNPQGGRLTVKGGLFKNTGFPGIDGYLSVRAITNTYWVMDGLATTMNIQDSLGNRKSAYVVSGSWPPTAASLTAAGVSPSTHFLVREA